MISEIQPKNNNKIAKKRLDQILFKPLYLNSFMPGFQYRIQMLSKLLLQQKERVQILRKIF